MLATIGNAINSLYVFSLPIGPIWFLHLFNLTCTLVMLAWHLRYAGRHTTGVADPATGAFGDLDVGVVLDEAVA